MANSNLFNSKSRRGINRFSKEMNKELRLANLHQLRYGKLLKQEILILSLALIKMISEDERSIKGLEKITPRQRQ
jgi:hypothetical protein